MSSLTVEPVRFELTRYPVIILRLPPLLTVPAVDAWHDEIVRLLDEARGLVALVHDGRQLDILRLSGEVRRRISERSRAALTPVRGERIVADARIMASATGAGLITVLGWLMGALPWPIKTFSDEPAALSWVERMLERARVSS